MDISKIFSNCLILAQNSGIRNDLVKEIRNQQINIVKSTGLGASALDDISNLKQQLNLILTDVRLNDIRAFDFLKEIRKQEKFTNTHILVMYGKEDIPEVYDLLDFKLIGTVEKPFRAVNFRRILLSRMGRFFLYNQSMTAIGYDSSSEFLKYHKKYEAAIDSYSKIIDIVETAQTHFDIGWVYILKEDPVSARNHMQKAVELDSKYLSLVTKFWGKMAIKSTQDAAARTKISPEAIRAFSLSPSQIKSTFFGIENVKKIMLVGGSHQERIGIKESLISIDIPLVQSFASGVEAINETENQQYQLIIFNIRTSDISGLQFLERLIEKINSSKTLFIMMLESDYTDKLEQAYYMGLDGHLIKPLTLETLCRQLNDLTVLHALTALTKKSHLIKGANFLISHGQIENAKIMLEAALKDNQEDGLTRLFLAIIAFLQHKQEESIIFFFEAIKLNQDLKPICQLMYRNLEKDEKEINFEKNRTMTISDVSSGIDERKESGSPEGTDMLLHQGVLPAELSDGHVIKNQNLGNSHLANDSLVKNDNSSIYANAHLAGIDSVHSFISEGLGARNIILADKHDDSLENSRFTQSAELTEVTTQRWETEKFNGVVHGINAMLIIKTHFGFIKT